MYRIGICDDEITFGNLIEKYLEEYARKKGIRFDISVFLTGEGYLESLREGMVLDLLFLDIEFGGGMDGVKVGEMLRIDLVNEATQIVYVSAVESYAMRLFRNRPMDFLPKPVKRQDIERVMNEYIRVFGKRGALFLSMELDAGGSGWRRMTSSISNVWVERWVLSQGRERMRNSMGAWTW